jgi:lipoprotein NlpD
MLLKKIYLFWLLFLFSCQHYPSNVEIIYKNSNSSGYKSSGSNIMDYENQSGKQNNSNIEKSIEKKAIQSNDESQPIKPLNNAKTLKPLESLNAEEVKKAPTELTEIKTDVKQEEKVKPNTDEAYHVVQSGETYYSIARLYHINPNDLMQWNEYKGETLKPATILRISKEGKVVAIKNELTTTQALQIKKQVQPASSLKPIEVIKAPISVGISECGEKFISPIKSNTIITKFGEIQGGGVKNDGIIFKVKQEEKILSAANGEVVYVGEGFSDYGKITILKHANNYFSIYGYLKDTPLNKGQFLMKGDVISSTSLKDGQFYFSIRKGKIPINPARCI